MKNFFKDLREHATQITEKKRKFYHKQKTKNHSANNFFL